MKTSLTLFTLLVFCSFVHARRGEPETEADYIVPTAPQYVAYSRFKVKIVDRFEGPETQKISYIFPEFLVGEAYRVITFKRIKGTENSWTSPELDAQCAVVGDEFTCNIYGSNFLQGNQKNSGCIISAKELGTESSFSRERALNHLPNLNLSAAEFKGLSGVINSFFCQEPRGFLTYDID